MNGARRAPHVSIVPVARRASGHAYDTICYLIRFLFVLIVRLANSELRLDEALYTLITDGALKLENRVTRGASWQHR